MKSVSKLFYFHMYGPDLAKSKSFYKEVLGWTIDGGSLGGHIASTKTPGGVSPGGSSTAVFFVVDDLQSALATVEQHGGKIISKLEYEGIGPAASCQDNQGTHFSLQQPGTDEMKQHARSIQKGSQHGDLHWFSLPVENTTKAMQFFGLVLGWTFEDNQNEKDKETCEGNLCFISNLKGPNGVLKRTEEDDARYPSFWFRVDDISQSIRLVSKLGGITGNVEESMLGRVCQCEDDQGVPFGIVQPFQ